jgi:uncharacterized protein YtpQ (UPF0354 family)
MVRLIAIVVFACWTSFALAQGATKRDVQKGAAPTARTEVLSKPAFTQKVAQELATRFPDAKFSVAGELTITRIEADGSNTEVSLDNLYRDYNSAPGELVALLRDFAAAIGEKCSADCGGKVDRTRIVPLIKDRSWIEGNRANLKKQQAHLDFVFEDFNDELVIVYVRDAEQRVRFLMSNEDLGVERGELRKLAVENLGRLRPEIKMHSYGNMLTMLDVGGTYEASLLLFETIWTDGQLKVNGDIVVAVPTGDVLLVTGSKNRKGISALREIATKFAAERSRPISDKLFVYREGSFKKFGRK